VGPFELDHFPSGGITVLISFRAFPRSRVARSRRALRVEELEARSLLSASALTVQPFLDVQPLNSPGSAPYSPAQIRHAYGFDQITFNNGTIKGDGTGQTIAIVDAYNDPNVASDLATFDRTFGLPAPPKLTVATPQGTPATNSGWSVEIALDVEWAHAIAPGANILLVEAASSSLTSLLGAVDYARSYAGVSVVSMSWGTGDFSGETNFDSHFTTPAGHTNVSFVASSGDNGAGVSWPSISSKVLSVGGTSLNLNSSGNYSSESGWSGSGGGYSAYVPRPSYQNGFQSNAHRSNPDVAYDANPSTGYYVYVTAGSNRGWYEVGGTSAGAPQWAALVAIADQGRALAGKVTLANVESDVYALSASDFHDITTGSNGYSAGTGYDLVTGRGSPYANKVVSDLVSGTISNAVLTSGGSSASKPTLTISATPPQKVEMPGGNSDFVSDGGGAGVATSTGSTPTGSLFDPYRNSSGSQAQTASPVSTLFSNFLNGDLQRMVESAWGYRAANALSNDQAGVTSHGKASTGQMLDALDTARIDGAQTVEVTAPLLGDDS
jgi:subtilase family serine protease